ncbi:MAG: tyrosine-type recombinase/integrase [Pyrinomonadaceae bacterium]|nr:tyrosine-type recombinase/integrase [Pyrinomonadaceae bacterium]
MKTGFRKACADAQSSNFVFHDLRHTFGTRLADAGVDVVKIKELMGHASIRRPCATCTPQTKENGQRSINCRLTTLGQHGIVARLSPTRNSQPCGWLFLVDLIGGAEEGRTPGLRIANPFIKGCVQ